MKVLLAPDSFKGTLSASRVAEIMAEALLGEFPDMEVSLQPVSDGGEGFLEACGQDRSHRVHCQVEDPLGRRVQAEFLRHGKRAIIEMARASGIGLLTDGELDPLKASTYGTGQLISEAVRTGCREIIVGLGGSATHDAGMGCLRALGVIFSNENGREITAFSEAEAIRNIRFTRSGAFGDVHVTLAADVTNPLLGPQGAAYIYSPQKGADDLQVERLEELTQTFAGILETKTHRICRQLPGAGAAGGIAFGLMCMLNATMGLGFDLVARLTDLEDQITRSDIVITGEGRYDLQSSFGKVPVRVCELSHDRGKVCLGIFGDGEVHKMPFDGFGFLTTAAGSVTEAKKQAEKFLGSTVVDVLRSFMASY